MTATAQLAAPSAPSASGDRRGRAALVVAALLLAGSGATAGWALTQQRHAPQPTAASAGVLDPALPPVSSARPPAGGTDSRTGQHTGSGPGSGSGQPNRPPVGLPRSLPVRLRIPAVGVSSEVQSLGLMPDGALAVPQPGPRYDRAAWYSGSPTPGQVGPSILEGHVDSASSGPSVFFRLGELRPGDAIEVTRADGSVAVFTVNAVRAYPKDAFPSALVYGNTDRPALRLLTCSGSFDANTGHYHDNTVVFAQLTGGQHATAPAV